MTAAGEERLIHSQVGLSSYTSWQIGGPAEYFCQPENIVELKQAWAWALARGHKVTVLGGGSNVLVSDRGIRGLVICLRKLNSFKDEVIERDGQPVLSIECEAGLKKSELLKTFLKYQLTPALFLAGIPGDIGGGVVMNAGVSESLRPREFCELVDWVEVLRPLEAKQSDENLKRRVGFELIRLPKEEIQWSYRRSKGWQPGILYRVGLSWPMVPEPNILAQVRELNRIRLQKQPLDLPSCGSVFKNPTGQKAARLIEQAGLKGRQIGEAQVSSKHANFIVNLGKATAEDTWSLMMEVKQKVFEKSNIWLETEVVRLGEWEENR